jgi:hypothetical protein
MAKKPLRPRDLNQLAKRIVDLTTGQATEGEPEPTFEEERASKGGDARAKNLTPEERSAIARKAAKARWDKP